MRNPSVSDWARCAERSAVAADLGRPGAFNVEVERERQVPDLAELVANYVERSALLGHEKDASPWAIWSARIAVMVRLAGFPAALRARTSERPRRGDGLGLRTVGGYRAVATTVEAEVAQGHRLTRREAVGR